MRGRPAVRPSTPGNHVAGLATDQRGDGYRRVSGIAADIGAFEVQPEPLAPVIAKGFAPSSIVPSGVGPSGSEVAWNWAFIGPESWYENARSANS